MPKPNPKEALRPNGTVLQVTCNRNQVVGQIPAASLLILFTLTYRPVQIDWQEAFNHLSDTFLLDVIDDCYESIILSYFMSAIISALSTDYNHTWIY